MTAAFLVRQAGLCALVGGILAAVWIYLAAPAEEDPGTLGLDVPTKSQRLQLERMGGKMLLLVDDLSDFWDSLWRGRRLAGTVATLSLAAFFASRRWAPGGQSRA